MVTKQNSFSMIPTVNSPTVANSLAAVTYAINLGVPDITQVSDRLWVSNIAVAWLPSELDARNITHVVCTTQFGEAAVFYPDRYNYCVVNIQDVPEADIEAQFDRAVSFIIKALEHPDHSVLVHCNQGKSRSVITAAAYLVRAKGRTPLQAIEDIRAVRPHACPNPGFIRQLAQYHLSLKKQPDVFEKTSTGCV